MAIIIKEGVEFYGTDDGVLKSVILTGNKISKELSMLKKFSLKSITLNYFKTKAIKDLDFLKSYSFIEEVNLVDLDINCSGLKYLEGLKSLSMDVINDSQKIEYDEFKCLEKLSVNWYPNFPDLSNNMSLRNLNIWKFKPKSKSLEDLKLPPNLEKLHITETNLESLNGLNISQLKTLEIYYASKLLSLDGIKESKDKLETLIIENAKNISDYKPLETVNKLKKVILTNCGGLPSLEFVNNNKLLNSLP